MSPVLTKQLQAVCPRLPALTCKLCPSQQLSSAPEPSAEQWTASSSAPHPPSSDWWAWSGQSWRGTPPCLGRWRQTMRPWRRPGCVRWVQHGGGRGGWGHCECTSHSPGSDTSARCPGGSWGRGRGSPGRWRTGRGRRTPPEEQHRQNCPRCPASRAEPPS